MWFGSRVKAENIEKLVCRLVDLGVVRRDDEKANLLWVLKPSESESLQDEAALAEQVKAENPKGVNFRILYETEHSPSCHSI